MNTTETTHNFINRLNEQQQLEQEIFEFVKSIKIKNATLDKFRSNFINLYANYTFLKVYLSNLFKFLGVVLTLQLLYCFSFNQTYEKSDFLISFICGLLYMTSRRQQTYDEAVLLTKKYNSLINEKNNLDEINEKLNETEK